MNVALREWQPADADALVAGIDEEVLRWIPEIPRPYRRKHAEQFLAAPPDDVSRAVLVDGDVVGSIGMRRMYGHGGHLGYWCALRARNRGVMTSALTQFCALALDELGLKRLELVADPDNVASLRLAERVGFQREGLLRSLVEHPDGRRRDAVIFSLLPGELRAQ